MLLVVLRASYRDQITLKNIKMVNSNKEQFDVLPAIRTTQARVNCRITFTTFPGFLAITPETEE